MTNALSQDFQIDDDGAISAHVFTPNRCRDTVEPKKNGVYLGVAFEGQSEPSRITMVIDNAYPYRF